MVPLGGNRDPAIAPGLAPLATGEWDAVIDTSGYVPRIVGASTELLADRVSRYIFVSSISVYASADRPGSTSPRHARRWTTRRPRRFRRTTAR